MFQEPTTQIEMVVLGLARELRFLEKRFAKSISFSDQTFDSLTVERIAHDQIAVFSKRVSLLLCEFHDHKL